VTVLDCRAHKGPYVHLFEDDYFGLNALVNSLLDFVLTLLTADNFAGVQTRHGISRNRSEPRASWPKNGCGNNRNPETPGASRRFRSLSASRRSRVCCPPTWFASPWRTSRIATARLQQIELGCLGSPGTGIRSAVPRCPSRHCGTCRVRICFPPLSIPEGVSASVRNCRKVRQANYQHFRSSRAWASKASFGNDSIYCGSEIDRG
jgi:hypothetical protein